MTKVKLPVTPAIRLLNQEKVGFTSHLYNYEERGGTTVSARELNIDEHQVIKTLVMEDDQSKPLIVLMHGDQEVSTKALARSLGVKTITPCNPDIAYKHTGYQVGGTSPFATRKEIPVYMEKSIQDIETLYINGGKRGFLVSMTPEVLIGLLKPKMVEVGINK